MTPVVKDKQVTAPAFRRIRAFAFDPSLRISLETAVMNKVMFKIPWEDSLSPGPVGEYLEVVDVDPASRAVYAPIDLNHPYLLADGGLPPSEGNPQFHQQMVYAVAMTTIKNFEEALGRRALWSPRIYKDEKGDIQEEYIPRLRIYPHALLEANAYYSPQKRALLFGYFPASTKAPGNILPGGIVFACLSHDIIAHETTHALLDGLHRRFIEPSNVDVLALHEAFADIVALFQHFSFPEVLRHQIARTRGDLAKQNLLAQLAQQFGQAIGRRGALRDALGGKDKKTGEWMPKEPDPDEIRHTFEPHARGAILVAAVFDAFLSIYKSRIADLLRIATGGSGVLPPGEIHPDLVGRLSEEAAKSSSHILRMCIRALDYCPPVDVTFGDYLRAMITADADAVPDDRLGYRLAVIEAFRRRGIYPLDVRSLSEESLLWRPPEYEDQESFKSVLKTPNQLRRLWTDWGLESDREAVYKQRKKNQAKFHVWLTDPPQVEAARALFLTLDKNDRSTIYQSEGLPSLEVHSVRPTHRVGPAGNTITDLVVSITQRRRGYYEAKVQEKADKGAIEPPPPDFIFRGGCTLLINLETGKVRYCISKRVTSDRRLSEQRRFLSKQLSPSLHATYFGDPEKTYFEGARKGASVEPFALLHRSHPREEAI